MDLVRGRRSAILCRTLTILRRDAVARATARLRTAGASRIRPSAVSGPGVTAAGSAPAGATGHRSAGDERDQRSRWRSRARSAPPAVQTDRRRPDRARSSRRRRARPPTARCATKNRRPSRPSGTAEHDDHGQDEQERPASRSPRTPATGSTAAPAPATPTAPARGRPSPRSRRSGGPGPRRPGSSSACPPRARTGRAAPRDAASARPARRAGSRRMRPVRSPPTTAEAELEPADRRIEQAPRIAPRSTSSGASAYPSRAADDRARHDPDGDEQRRRQHAGRSPAPSTGHDERRDDDGGERDRPPAHGEVAEQVDVGGRSRRR